MPYGSVHYPLEPAFVDGMETHTTSATQVTIEPGVCRDETDSVNIELTSAATPDITASGPGGLVEAETEAADTWYRIWVLSGTAGTSTLLSESSDPEFPSGYNYRRQIGWVRNNSSLDFISIWTIGKGRFRRTMYGVSFGQTVVLMGGTATVDTVVDCGAYVPPGSDDVSALVYYSAQDTAGTSNGFIFIYPSAIPGSPIVVYANQWTAGNGRNVGTGVMVPMAGGSRNFTYNSNLASNSLSVYIQGYEYVI